MKAIKILVKIVAVFVVLMIGIYGIGYVRARKVNKALDVASTKAMKARLLTLIPIGTPIDVASGTMEKQGFRCSMVKNATFLEKDLLLHPLTDGMLHPPSDYLYCEGTHPYTFWIGGAWYIDIAKREEKVSDVFVANYRPGP